MRSLLFFSLLAAGPAFGFPGQVTHPPMEVLNVSAEDTTLIRVHDTTNAVEILVDGHWVEALGIQPTDPRVANAQVLDDDTAVVHQAQYYGYGDGGCRQPCGLPPPCVPSCGPCGGGCQPQPLYVVPQQPLVYSAPQPVALPQPYYGGGPQGPPPQYGGQPYGGDPYGQQGYPQQQPYYGNQQGYYGDQQGYGGSGPYVGAYVARPGAAYRRGAYRVYSYRNRPVVDPRRR